jgi:hypothetical protein
MAKKGGKGAKGPAKKASPAKPSGKGAGMSAIPTLSPYGTGLMVAMTSDIITDAGLQDAQKFFDKVDIDDGLQAAITVSNGNVIALAATLGFTFNYAEMSAHLRARWKVQEGPQAKYCTF